MAGYRPKSLDDINQSYDSEMKVTRAIKRETSRLSESAPSVAEVFSDPKPEKTDNELNHASGSDNPKRIEDLSFAVEDFIKQLSVQNSSDVKRKPSFESSRNSRASEQPAFRKEESIYSAPASENQFMSGRAPIAAQNIPDLSKGRSEDDFSSLMSDYVKIMNDLDDEVPEKKSFIRGKKNKKKASSQEAENISEEDLLDQEDEIPAETASEETDKSSDNNDDYYGSFADLFEEDCEAEGSDHEEDENPAEADFEDEEIQKPKRSKETKAKKPKADAEEYRPKDKSGRSGTRIFFRTIFSIILAVSVLCTLAVGSVGIIFHINEGVSAPGSVYLFTASREFEQSGISSGDLVVCKAANSAQDDQTVVYVDRENKTFSFGVKKGSITLSDGEIYYIIDDNTIMRGNVLGTVDRTIPTLGKIIGIIYSYYIIILAALLVLSIVLFLIVTVALRNRNEFPAKKQEEADDESALPDEDDDDDDEEETAEVPEEELTDNHKNPQKSQKNKKKKK